MRVLAHLLLLLVVACPGPPAAAPTARSPAPGSTPSLDAQRAPGACPEASSDTLLAAANLEGEAQGAPSVYSAQLDGEGEPETVLSVRVARKGEPEEPRSPLTLTDHLVVFACRGGSLTLTTDWTFDATPDHGTLDCETGVRRIDVQRVAEREMLAVTTHQCQGSVDPRWDVERMLLLAYTAGGLEEVFGCALLEEHATGPCRSGASVRRRVEASDEPTPTIRVVVDRTFNPGACDEGPGPGEADSSREATYSWSGSAFVPSGDDVCR